MSTQSIKRARRNGWTWAVAASCVVHVFVLTVLMTTGRRSSAGAPPDVIAVDLAPEPPPPTTGNPTASRSDDLSDPPPPAVDEAKVARPLDAPEGERDNAIAMTAAPRVGPGRERAKPAPDQGMDGGHLAELATRHDRSTLQSRVSDADDAAQPSRLRTSRHAASPQADRHERRTGTGDSVRTMEATRARSVASTTPPPAATPPAPPDASGARAGAKDAARLTALALTRVSDNPSADRGMGPLAVEPRARSFDTEARGRAADDATMRAASTAAHLGVTDFSHAGAVAEADSLQGHGPGSAPGAVARPSNGEAPSVYGARSPQALAADLAERTREREYNRYRQGIAQRLNNVMKFPRNLLLHLEQGEAVVTFDVRPDGSLRARPRLVKSSGFREFDAEAVDVVLRAAPFGRRPDTGDLTISLPVTFENPVVR